jgi:putative oxidoreductase
MNLGLFVLRLVVGLLFAGHGAQKLFGSFGGHGLEGTAGFFEAIGLKPGHIHASAAGVLEFAGGILLALGFLTPLASAMLIAVMTAAVIIVHGPKGIWSTNGGYEYNLVLAAVAFALAAAGVGAWSIDHALSLSVNGVLWAVGALILGVIGGFAAVAGGRSYAARERQQRPQPAQRPTTA